MEEIRVMLVDDHPLVRQGLRRVLEAECDIVIDGEAADGYEALQIARQKQPHVILMDINLPQMNGLQVTRRLKAEIPKSAVIVLTGFDNEEQQLHAVQAGASAYFSKEILPDQLVEAIRQVHKGKYIIGGKLLEEEQVRKWLFEQFERFPQAYSYEVDTPFEPLSPREMQILESIAKGLSNKEIAHQLGISRQTVKNHMTAILRKLGVSDRTQAAVYALRHGWIRLQDTKVTGEQ